MKKWIRWQGLLAFASLVILLAVFWLIFADGIVKRAIQTYGTRAVGARVDLAVADLSLFPLGLRLEGLTVANPDRPMENIVAVSQADFLMDPMYLLRRKLIIAEMSLTGVRMNTPRKTSGAVAAAPEKERVEIAGKPSGGFCAKDHLPAFERPDVREILSREKLESLDLIRNLQQEYASARSDWQKRLQGLPGKEKFEAYRKRIEQLKSGARGLGGLLGTVGDLSSLQQEIQADLDRLKDAEKQFENSKTVFGNRLETAAAAPLKDAERLKQKYSLSAQGLDNLGKLVLGQKICGGLQQAARWYERLQYLLERAGPKGAGKKQAAVRPARGAGTDVRFREAHPQPDFLIRRAQVSFVHEIGELAGKVENITPDQDILGKPLVFDFAGEKLKDLKDIRIDGRIDRTRPDKPLDVLDLQLDGYSLHNASLSGSKDLPVNIEQGLADLGVKARIAGESLQADFSATLKSARFSAGETAAKGPVLAAVGSALSGLSGFSLKGALSGTLSDYQVRVSTDLDQVLKNAAGRIIRQQAQKFERELKQAVMEKAGGPLGDLQSEKKGFDAVGSQLAERLNLGNDLLGSLKRLL